MKRTIVRLSHAGFAIAGSSAEVVARRLIRGYKLIVSPYFAGSCRFLPSCADYADEAIAVHGIRRGTWLTARRLARCHPLCSGGHDPVPARSRAERHPVRIVEAA